MLKLAVMGVVLLRRLWSSHEKTRSKRMLPPEANRSSARWAGYSGVSQL